MQFYKWYSELGIGSLTSLQLGGATIAGKWMLPWFCSVKCWSDYKYISKSGFRSFRGSIRHKVPPNDKKPTKDASFIWTLYGSVGLKKQLQFHNHIPMWVWFDIPNMGTTWYANMKWPDYINIYIRNHTYIHTYMHTYMHTCIHAITNHYVPLHTITYHYIPLHTTTYHCIHTLHYITLHCIALHYITLHCITLHYITYIHYIFVNIYIYKYIYKHIYIHIYIYILERTSHII